MKQKFDEEKFENARQEAMEQAKRNQGNFDGLDGLRETLSCAQKTLKELRNAFKLPWRAYKQWIFDCNDDHVIGESELLNGLTADFIVDCVNSREEISKWKRLCGEMLNELKKWNEDEYYKTGVKPDKGLIERAERELGK